jgi:hypothetical protein
MQVGGRGGPGSEPYQDRRLAGAEWHMRRQKRRCPVLGPGGLRARSPRRSLVTPSKFSTELRGIPAQVPEVRRLSPLEGDGLELLVPRQESPGFPKHPGSGRDGRGPICLTPPSPSSAGARPRRHLTVPARQVCEAGIHCQPDDRPEPERDHRRDVGDRVVLACDKAAPGDEAVDHAHLR